MDHQVEPYVQPLGPVSEMKITYSIHVQRLLGLLIYYYLYFSAPDYSQYVLTTMALGLKTMHLNGLFSMS